MRVLTGIGSAVLEVRKSRFLASAAYLADPAAASALIAQHSDPAARHNCWAWRCGQSYRFHDAGEPGGTAGKPILGAIDAEAIDQVLVVVTRHFGGIKLGTGGLVRAYSKVSIAALRAAPAALWRALSQVRMRIPISRRSLLEHALSAFDGVVLDHATDLQWSHLTVSLPSESADRWHQRVQDICAGRAEFLLD